MNCTGRPGNQREQDRVDPDIDRRVRSAEDNLEVSFKDRGLLRLALIHSSYLNERLDRVEESNERLEFLGDAIVGAVVAEELYRRHPDLPEGKLTEYRATVVQRNTLAQAARGLSLGEGLLMGRGEEGSGGRERNSNLSAVFESVVGALFLDQGYDRTRVWVLSQLGPYLDEPTRLVAADNPKSALQEEVQAKGLGLPTYRIVSESGTDHERTFTAEVIVEGNVAGTGSGSRKTYAEREAARAALQAIER